MQNKPNFLFVQADQLAARALPAYGNRVAKTPNIDRLASEGVVFEHAYCNYPLCAPSRLSMMSGLLPTRAGAWDNGAEFAASLPTFIHYLRLLGYRTCLSGKMHFIGPDQLHGFEERLNSDIYPADFNWTANWSSDDTLTDGGRLLAAAGEVNGIKRSGVYERTVQLDYDDEVAFRAVRKIHDFAGDDDNRPFCLFVSFTHPHDPFAVPRNLWDRYRHEDIDMPAVAPVPREQLDPHSRRLYDHIGVADAAMTEEDVRIARHAYYGAVSYIDDQLGALVNALRTNGIEDNTVIVFISDHGEALGERGLWFKRSFFDCALQVPLIIRAPAQFPASRCSENVSLVDLFPTVVDMADPHLGLASIETAFDGRNLRTLCEGTSGDGQPVIAEMMGEGLEDPAVAVIDGPFKYIHCDTDPPQLYERTGDPDELHNLAGQPDVSEVEKRLRDLVATRYDVAALKQVVLESQRRRRIVDRAHQLGRKPEWDYAGATAADGPYFRACDANPSASNYNSQFEVRRKPDSETPNRRSFP